MMLLLMIRCLRVNRLLASASILLFSSVLPLLLIHLAQHHELFSVCLMLAKAKDSLRSFLQQITSQRTDDNRTPLFEARVT